MAGKLKFGIRLNIQGEMGAPSSGFAYTLEMAQLAESLGFDSVWIPDHVENDSQMALGMDFRYDSS